MLVPKPAEHTVATGSYRLPAQVTIGIPEATARLREIADILVEVLAEAGASSRIVVGAATPGDITLISGGPLDDESYRLAIDSSGISITAPGDAGVLWGVQTLRQLLHSSDDLTIAAAQIDDWPSYRWRGAMLDVGRHFFPVEYILSHLDWMSRHKLNVFHWHLTEDQGWRIEIDALPRLTEIGAWREAAGTSSLDGPTSNNGRYGGYYSKADVRRVVEHARRLGITVVPEIEMPGHSRAAIAAYPHLGCTGDTLPVPTTWGVFTDVLCPTEATFTFLETVLTEVLELFPSRYIHLGGDEVPGTRWRECAECQEIIAREGLGDEHGLQGWMMKRMNRWLAERGRTMIGWDEILDGGAPEGAVVQAWQGSDRIAAAIAAGADVIASPNEFVYLNTPPDRLTLERVLQFDPAAAVGAGQGRLLGAEAPLWTEHITSATNAELMWWPRLLGFAEAVWTGPGDPKERAQRVQIVAERIRRDGVSVGPIDQALFTLRFSFDTVSDRLRINFDAPLDDLELRLSDEVESNLIASGDLLPSHGEWQLNAELGTATIGEPRTISLTRHLALGKPLSFVTPADVRYPGTGTLTLVDGACGGDFADGFWNGWWGPDLDATIDLEAVEPIGRVTLSLLEQVNSWILYPESVELMLASSPGDWRSVERRVLDHEVNADAASRLSVSFTTAPGTVARWVRVIARSRGTLPTWHSGAGQASWIFADEIIVEP